MTTSLLEKPSNQPLVEKNVTISGVTWKQFKTIEAQLENNPTVKLTYLAGVLEIMSPIGPLHEYVKRTLNLLLEAYMREKGIRFYALGGFTLEETGYSSGNPDDSYSIGNRKEVPDIVIEAIVTGGTLDKRELYKPKKVPEVWFCKSNQLRVFCLREEEYVEVGSSFLLPDLGLLRRYLGYDDQYDAVNEFVREIRDRG